MTQAALSIDVEPDTLIADSVKASLFAKVTEDIAAYAIVDGQWCEDIYGRLLGDEHTDWCSLIAGEVAQELALTAPYLVRLEQDSDLTNWLIEEGWGKGWGIYFLASKSKAKELYRTPPPESLKQQVERGAFVASPDISEDEATDVVLLRRHFRRYLRVEFESDGRLVRFRFFDPAVLRVWLLSTNQMETQAFFGPITDFIAEDWCEEPSLCNAHQLWHFAAPASGQHCKAGRFNMRTHQITPMTPITESSTQTNERPKSHITLIRKAQEKAFEDMQWELFSEQMVQELAEEETQADAKKYTAEQLRSFTREQVRKARELSFDEFSCVRRFVLWVAAGGQEYLKNDQVIAHLKNSEIPEFERLSFCEGLVKGR
ncbi:DUF4123 domain-containing protein [Pseudovibrio sp. POLY-S9]|uniref:DUF4123 domain-containing protein n=1 Tax=Pseudovibrio sp. POLY-S9 TaxID=1576596 RepID=UPI00070B71E7|nr:DUF4123 domain-containing protein [Pseudovibrio sp. POLY-S9]